MKQKILTLIIGILIGAIVTAGVFLVIGKNTKKSFNRDMKGMSSEMREGAPERRTNGTSGEKTNSKGGKSRTKEKTENTTENNNAETQPAATSDANV